MNDSLRALVLQSQVLEESLIESGGLLSTEYETMLANIEAKLPAKIDAYATLLERLEMAEEYWKEKAKQYQAIAKGCTNARERLKDSLKAAAGAMNTDELLGNDVRFKISNSKPKLVVDELQLPGEYLTEKVVYEPDNAKITADLKAGKEVSGAKFVESKSIRTYALRGV